MLMKLTPGVNFTNILGEAFISADHKRTKKDGRLDCLFVNLGSSCIRAARKLLMKLTP